MRRRFRLPMFVVVAALAGLLAVLAALQYKWLGRISNAERESRRSMLAARATAFASDFDKELALAYALFQLEPVFDAAGVRETLTSRFSARYDRWLTSSRFPRLIKEYFLASRELDGSLRLHRFDTSSKVLEPAAWPGHLQDVRSQIAGVDEEPADEPSGRVTNRFFVRRVPGALREDVPALLVPMPILLLNPPDARVPVRLGPHMSFAVLVLDRDYITREVLPTLAEQHLRTLGDGVAYDVAVVAVDGRGAIYRSSGDVAADPAAKVDVTADLFQVRVQDFPEVAADVRRFMLTLGTPPGHGIPSNTQAPATPADAPQNPRADRLTPRDPGGRAVVRSVAAGLARAAGERAGWRLLVRHPSGSLEAAVDSTRRRNLIVSFTILAVLGASMALLVLSARRAHETARQQMEFVATVSHELRTPLAVIRSAGDNLADGVVDAERIRTYGQLVRSEGRRLSEMVEQILEYAGIGSGQRRLEPRPVAVAAVLHDVLTASAALIGEACIEVETDIPLELPPVLGDERALRRVFQNLVDNAIKYGGDRRWLGIRARDRDDEIHITIADRGLGIAPTEHAGIFEPFYRAPDVVAAQIQGAGLGLSLVARIVEAHGGRVTVDSAPAAGSKFTVHLPAARVAMGADAEPRAAGTPRYT